MARSLIATETGVKLAEEALIDLGLTKGVIVKRLGCSRATVSKFFNGNPVAHENFTKICSILKLEWREIADRHEEGTVELETTGKWLEQGTLSTVGAVRQETLHFVYDKMQPRLAFAIAGTIDQVDQAKLTAIVQLLRKMTSDASIEIVDVQEGSIKLILTGTPQALAKIQTLYRAGELTEVDGRSIVSVGFENLRGVNLNGVNLSGANLSGVNLSGVNLSGANLIGANLIGANLIGANFIGVNLSEANLSEANLSEAYLIGTYLIGAYLIGTYLIGANLSGTNLSEANFSEADLSEADLSIANLRGANLRGANLRGVNLIGANLSEANLSEANLRGANLRGAIVEFTRFGFNGGISEEMKRDLITRGAIFDDLRGDQSKVVTPSRV